MTAHFLPQRPVTLGKHKDDGYIRITETVTETVRIVTRPATPEEIARLGLGVPQERGIYRGVVQPTEES